MAYKDLLKTRKTLKTAHGSYDYFSLKELEQQGLGKISALPYSMKVLLESALRNLDGIAFTPDHVKAIAQWNPTDVNREEIPYKPARVVLQDFTGVPAVVDLAAMRDAMKRLGGDPKKINPIVPCDLVIDHSVQVDYFGRADALQLNEELEFTRNKERYEFLKWGQGAFSNFRVVPPSTGIVHQVNLEYLSSVVFTNAKEGVVYPDSCVGTDSHTPMVNGLAVLAWGVGGIEAEAVMLDQPLYMLIPDVIGFKLTGELPEGATATDLVLRITEMCRKEGVVEKFVEFYGEGLSSLSVANRSTIGNMAPEQGSTVSFFPIDEETLKYLELSGRDAETIALVEAYAKEQGFWRDDTNIPTYTKSLELDLSTIEPAMAGPKRPHDRLALKDVGKSYQNTLSAAPSAKDGYGIAADQLGKTAVIKRNGEEATVGHGFVGIAAITSCTNTSNPSVMLAAGLVAKKAVEKGLTVPCYVKTSLAPGSGVVTEYLEKANLLKPLEQVGFHVVGYGCTTCIGNSGSLPDEVAEVISKEGLVASAVLSGNRNFEGRVNPLTQTNYLASPPLVVAYALFGTTAKDITTEPIGTGKDGKAVFLKDIWPSNQEVEQVLASCLDASMFKKRYGDVWKGSAAWQAIKASPSELFPWDIQSTYIQSPPFFETMTKAKEAIKPIKGAKVLGLFGDSVTTDHISPAGSIAKDSPAARYLTERGVQKADFNSYGSRRGNDRIMHRGTFANIRIKNLLVPGKEGNLTVHHGSGDELSFFDASERYREAGTPLVVLAGQMYGNGSSRDWAAKGPFLMGIKAVIAQSFERIHRSNLVGMGIAPLQFKDGQSASSLGLAGTEAFDIHIDDALKPGQDIKVTAHKDDGSTIEFSTRCRIDTPVEVQYYRDGGILQTVVKQLL
jgi:aconitate hydratase